MSDRVPAAELYQIQEKDLRNAIAEFPKDELYVVMMIQAPHARTYMRALLRGMVYAAIED